MLHQNVRYMAARARPSAITSIPVRSISSNTSQLNVYSFPCPICANPKPAHLIACSSSCLTKLSTDHPEIHEKFLTLEEDIVFAQQKHVQAIFNRFPSFKPSNSVTSWQTFLHEMNLPPSVDGNPSIERLVSATYSYAMTLRHYLPYLQLSSPKRIHIHLIGARAEATMPRYLWDVIPQRMNISMIGNHVPIMPSKFNTPRNDTIQITYHQGLYHDLTMALPDAFVLFHPGFGHSHLSSQWIPTLRHLLNANRPILFTSFSQEDLNRDIQALQHVATRIQRIPKIVPTIQLNPFGSMKCTIDPSSLLHPIHSNRYVCWIN